MSKAATLTTQEAQYKTQAQGYLTETRRILRQLAADRQREERRRQEHQREKPSNILSEVKAILQNN